MGRLIAAVLFIASGVCLYFALTQPIVISRMVSLNEMIHVIYPEAAFEASKPADATPAPAPEPGQPTAYEKRITQYEKMVTGMVLGTDAAKQNFADLTAPKGYTAWQSAHLLYDAGDMVSGTLIIAFSIAYPILKTLALLVLIATNAKQATALKLAELTHKYTMLDVFVAAVTLVALSTQKLLVINTGPAIPWYVGYLVLGFAGVLVLIRAGKTAAAPSAG
jgi:hypothetical protein